jgi:hypothetical protein
MVIPCVPGMPAQSIRALFPPLSGRKPEFSQ